MKDGLGNIDEIFKQAFDGFEANVDPGVWNNIQNSIGSGVGSTPQLNPANAAGTAMKSVAMKIVAGVVLVGSVATGSYFIINADKEQQTAATENIIAENNNVTEQPEEKVTVVVKEEENTISINENIPVEQSTSVQQKENKTSQKTTLTENSATSAQADMNGTNSSPSLNGSEKDVTPDAASDASPDKKEENTKTEDTQSQKTPEPKEVLLKAKINVDVTKGKAPLTVQFDAIGNGIQYFWDFKDGSGIINEDSPTHTFFKDGTYRVALQAIDKYGNAKMEYKTIVVEKNYDSSLEPLQNVLTPNGDGQNDVYKIRGNNIIKLEAVIMDKTGKPIYTIKSMDDYWDGKDQSGDYVIQGQYYISGMAIGDDGKKHFIKQAINVLN